MGRQQPKPTRQDIRSWDRFEKTPVEHFCAKCGVWYPATSNAHAGH